MYLTEQKNPLEKIILGSFTHAQHRDRDTEDFIIFSALCTPCTDTSSPAVTSSVLPAIVSRLTHIQGPGVPNPPHPYLL